MNVMQAAYETAHGYPGGTDTLADRLRMSSGAILRGKVNINDEGHHLRLDEAMAMMEAADDDRILFAMCEARGYMPPVKRVDFIVSDAALLETFTKMLAELGDFSKEFQKSLQDGKITRHEIGRMRKEMFEFFGAGEELISRAEQLVEVGA